MLARNVIALSTAAIWIGIFIAGLWPFDFIPKNRASWLPNREGVYFDGYGQIDPKPRN